MNVSVFKPQDRNNYICRWVDPVTGKKKSRSAGTNNKREAERFAGKLEKELAEGTYHEAVRMTWDAFRERFKADYLPDVAESTRMRFQSCLNTFEDIIDPQHLRSVTSETLNRYKAELRRRKRTEATVKTNLVHIKVALNWAVKQGFIPACPSVAMPKATDTMKGRPITEEEFDRMIEKIDCINAKDPDEWRFLLRGLWWSGLRLGEALKLHWTDENHMCVDLDNELIIMQAHSHKAKRYIESPMAPEFADMLRKVPVENREGFVFNPLGNKDMGTRLRTDTASKLITKIGKKAMVKVAESKDGKEKFASAHDLRRAFGFRWSRRVSSTILKELMRHSNISTTEKFYVGLNAKDTVKRLRESIGTSLGTSDPKAQKETHDKSPQVSDI